MFRGFFVNFAECLKKYISIFTEQKRVKKEFIYTTKHSILSNNYDKYYLHYKATMINLLIFRKK